VSCSARYSGGRRPGYFLTERGISARLTATGIERAFQSRAKPASNLLPLSAWPKTLENGIEEPAIFVVFQTPARASRKEMFSPTELFR